jgi:predicted P-loop ATPase
MADEYSNLVPDYTPQDSWIDKVRWKSERNGVMDNAFAMHNAILAVSYADQIGGGIVLDEFNNRETVVKPLPWDRAGAFEVRPVNNDDITQTRAWLELKGLKMNKNTVLDAIKVAAGNHRFNPARDYLDGLVWDGRPRLDDWIITYLGATAQPAEYVRRVAACWLIAAVKRIYEPGAPFHHMLVLEGGQAAGKSTSLRTLATFGTDKPVEYFSDRITFDHIDRKEFAEFAAGHVILEFQELSGMGKKDRNKIKQWITQTADEYKRPYDAVTTIYPRQFVLAGTTNESQWLTDPTGDRRFWPVRVSDKINTDGLMTDRHQIWAEAVHRYKAKELWYIKNDDPVYKLMQTEQSVRYMGDPWEDIILEGIEMRQNVTVDEVFTEILNVPKERWDRTGRSRICDTLTKNGWENTAKWCPYSKKNVRKWCRKEQTGQADMYENDEEIAF